MANENEMPTHPELQSQISNDQTLMEANKDFTPEQQKKIQELANQIEPMNYDSLMKFGSNAQSSMSTFAHKMLTEVKSKDTGPIGDTLNQLMVKLKEVQPDDFKQEKDSFIKKIFKRAKASANEIFSRMQSVGSQVDRISVELKNHKDGLNRDIQLLNGLYDQNKDYFEELNLYIAAAQEKKQAILEQELPEKRQKAYESGNQMDIQEVADLEQFADRLDKRIYDLQLSRQISLQTAPQIRMIQNVNQTLAEKIQSSILTSIPLWKNQMAIALTLMRQRQAMSAQRAVTDTTNDLLTANSELLKQNAVDTAVENERGIVDIETLKSTHENIIETVEQTLQIQAEGREKRQQAEQELQHLEADMKERLLTMKENKVQ
ncbi:MULTISPECIES: toxic anion resistance protein [Staphylococcus]|uniref:toxic anion resistance protein n=1 Tax=Staphylococcus TaxID=1279 RepID=UPI00029949E8|nr:MULTISPECIES: toxic anion resistance protein [Staphylococcus]AMG96135.1 toxic anion resistance protein [Staphylococcus simulans]ATF31650.1 toxic anion resistance protein [Staphylococcus simulans]AVO02197.1 tellurite resistance protein TelA [Staphylococcus simulans]AVO05143.1 tellurite resistance protein TelA [Staphylococcus simulans]AWG18746.1 tellurite resistance protein TelA [Staphylococcus simulans]